jgi:hypothetical protein
VYCRLGPVLLFGVVGVVAGVGVVAVGGEIAVVVVGGGGSRRRRCCPSSLSSPSPSQPSSSLLRSPGPRFVVLPLVVGVVLIDVTPLPCHCCALSPSSTCHLLCSQRWGSSGWVLVAVVVIFSLPSVLVTVPCCLCCQLYRRPDPLSTLRAGARSGGMGAGLPSWRRLVVIEPKNQIKTLVN